MSTIPLPALDVRPPAPPENQLDQYSRLLQLKNAQQMIPLELQQRQQGIQSGQLQIQQEQQAVKDQQGIANWYKSFDPNDPNSTDPIAVGRSLAQSGVSGAGIMKVQQGILQQRQTLATLTKDQLANQQTVSDNLANGVNGIIGETDPVKRAAAITPLIQTAAQNRLIQPQAAQQLLQNPGAVTDDQLKQFQHGLTVSAAFTQAAARSQQAQNSALELKNKLDPNSPMYAPSQASVALGTAPGAAQIQSNAVQQAAVKASAEAKARQPYELQLAAQRQALSQGDPRAAGQLLVNGDATLSELKSRGATPDFIAKTLFAANQLSGGKYNAQAADAQFNVAKSPENVKFFGSAKSLTDPGGTLDQLTQTAKGIPQNQIPVLNSIADWEKAKLGSGPIAQYAAQALGVADDYSKVMGGGQGSDASRQAALNLISAAQSPEQRAAAIQGIRGAVTSQAVSRIGQNSVLKRMYGDNLSSAAKSGPPSGATHIVPGSDGKLHYTDGKSDLGVVPQ